MRKIYLDSNILVAYFATGVHREKLRRKQIVEAFEVISDLDIEMYISMWTITEFVKVMINEKKVQPSEANRIANDLAKKPVIEDQKLTNIEPSPLKKYSCDELFFGVREIMTSYNPGWGDAFQIVIMRNHNIKEVLSFDRKKDFQIVPGITVLDPRTFVKPVLKIQVSN